MSLRICWLPVSCSIHFILTATLLVLALGGCRQEPAAVSPANTAHEQGPREPGSAIEDVPRAAAMEGGRSDLDSLLSNARAQHDIPALAAVVVRSDSILAYGATGIRRKDFSAPVSPYDWFHLGSNTKALTATLIALLVEDGALSWGTTPVEVFPGWSTSIDPAFRDITIEQLLAHRAGVQPFTNMREYRVLPPFDGDPKERRAAFSQFLLQRQPAYPPDSVFVYSNAGYAVVAAMAEQVVGTSFEQMMRNRLFRPLGIHGGFGWPAAVDSSQPWGHRTWRGDTTLQVHDPRGPYRLGLGPLWAAAGDVHMSPPDYGRFLQLHLRGLRGKEPPLLSAASIQDMHASRGQIAGGTDAAGYGLGWVIVELLGARTSGHAGSVETFKARAAIQPSHDLAVAVVANAGDEADAATNELRNVLLERYRSKQ